MLRCRLRSPSGAGEGGGRGGERGGRGRRAGLGGALGGLACLGAGPLPLSAPEDFLYHQCWYDNLSTMLMYQRATLLGMRKY